MNRPTRLDVARAAGVSPTTVSFVVNGRLDQGISEKTRAHVLAVAAQLEYVPQAQARALRRGTNDVVLTLLPALPPSAILEQLRELLSSELHAAGLTCVFAHVTDLESPLTSIRRNLDPAAVLSLASLPAADRAALDRSAIPYADGLIDPRREPNPLVDQAAIGALQVEHLVELGHRRIGVAASTDPRDVPSSAARSGGVVAAAARLGLPAPSVRGLDCPPGSARAALSDWMRDGVTAVAAHDDLVALAVLAGARALGLASPGDLAIVGVDDLPVAALTDPSLTSIALDATVPAARVVEHILALLEGRPHELEPVLGEQWLTLRRRATT